MKNKYSRTGQDTEITKSHIPLLVSSENLYENNTVMKKSKTNKMILKSFSQNLFKCSFVNKEARQNVSTLLEI